MQSIQIITNEIELRVFNSIDEEYNKIKSKITERSDKLINTFNTENNKYNELLDKNISKLDNLFDNFIINSNISNKIGIMISIKEFIDILKKIQSTKSNKNITLNDTIDSMDKLCKEIPIKLDSIKDIKNGDTTMELYQKILNTNSIIIVRPLIGKIVITMNDIEKTLDKKSTDLYTFIDEIINNFDFTSFDIRSENLIKTCIDEYNRLITLKDKDNGKNDIIEHMYEYVFKIVEIIQSSNLRKNSDLIEFVNLLDSVLGIEIEIEVMEPDTDKDDLYARILDICVVNVDTRDTYRRNNLVEIGINLGFSIEELENLTDLQLCDKYSDVFRY